MRMSAEQSIHLFQDGQHGFVSIATSVSRVTQTKSNLLWNTSEHYLIAQGRYFWCLTRQRSWQWDLGPRAKKLSKYFKIFIVDYVERTVARSTPKCEDSSMCRRWVWQYICWATWRVSRDWTCASRSTTGSRHTALTVTLLWTVAEVRSAIWGLVAGPFEREMLMVSMFAGENKVHSLVARSRRRSVTL